MGRPEDKVRGSPLPESRLLLTPGLGGAWQCYLYSELLKKAEGFIIIITTTGQPWAKCNLMLAAW